MANPTIVSTTPGSNATDVILGTSIVVTFSTIMNPATINSSTFSLTGPSGSQILTPNQLIQSDPGFIAGRNFITGTFATATVNGATVLTFTPSQPLQPNQVYTVLLIGAGSVLVSSSIADTNGNQLNSSYSWTFVTGALNTTVPPQQSPLPYQFAVIDPTSIRVLVNGNESGSYLNQAIQAGYVIDLVFPQPIDTTSFEVSDILLSLEQFLGDPTIPMPTGLTPEITIVGNTISISIQGS